MLSHARLGLPVPVESWQKEINSLTAEWDLHCNYKHFEGKWTVLPLRSPGGRSHQINPDAMQGEAYADTSSLQSCPSIRSWLKELRCPLMSLRLVNLKPGSVIKEHRDHELSFENGEARLHIPVFTNPEVEFYLNNTPMKMLEGECWYINANLPHRVSNKGLSDRIHLVIDCKVNGWLED